MSMIGDLTFLLDIQVKQTKQGTFMHQAKYMKDIMKKFNMPELKSVSTSMSSVGLLSSDEDGEAVDQRVQEHDRLPPVPHSDTAGHSVRRGAVCMLLGFPTLFASDGSSVSFQVSQTHY
jgi:hypothetical protein